MGGGVGVGGGTELGRKFMSLLSNLVQVSDVPHVPGSSSLLEGGKALFTSGIKDRHLMVLGNQ